MDESSTQFKTFYSSLFNLDAQNLEHFGAILSQEPGLNDCNVDKSVYQNKDALLVGLPHCHGVKSRLAVALVVQL